MGGKRHGNGFWQMTEAYLSQPLFIKGRPVFINPFKFSQDCQVQLLERCWQRDYKIEACRLRLEDSWGETNLMSAN